MTTDLQSVFVLVVAVMLASSFFVCVCVWLVEVVGCGGINGGHGGFL